MKRKVIGFSILTCFMLAMLALPGQAHGAAKFSDTSGHWAEKYINEAVSQGVVQGYPDGKFLPDKAVTRAEFATVVNKALGNTGTASISFKDVPSYEWYYTEISKAVAATYVAGYDDNTYKPNSSITRQEAAVMISRFVPTYGKSGSLTSFSDYRKVDEWAYVALQKVNGKGYIGGYDDGGIHPQDQLTRAQTAKIICDILDKETIVKSNTVVKNDGTKLTGRVYSNNVTMHSDLDEDSAAIDNSIILGTLTVQGGGVDTITVTNSRVSRAVVDKDDTPVRILAKGETAISYLTASENSILQTSGLSGGFYGPGFSNISVRSSADVTFKGSFPLVTIDGAGAKLILDSGTISDLTITTNGRRSDITLASGTTISNATANGEAYFHGTGTISHMGVNANGVTYETKPKNWTIASRIETPKQADPALEIEFSPKNGATKVALDTKLTLTFNTAMKLYNGNTIKNTDIEDFITLRKGSSSGTSVKFSASINSAKKIITITPDTNLENNTRYYVVLDKNSLRDSYDTANTAQTIYFNTGTSALTTTFTPKDGATTIPVNTSITIAFSEGVVRYSNGATISTSDSYLKDCIIFKEDSSRGKDVAYSATINSKKNTITIKSSSDLSLNKKYYVAVVANKLKNSGGTVIPAASASFTTGYTTPALSNFTVTPGDTSVVAKMTPNVAGKVYAMLVPSGTGAPTAAQILAGYGSLATAKNENVSANAVITLPTMTGLSTGTNYDVWATLYSNASGTYSTPVKVSATTTQPKVYLSGLSVAPVGGSSYNIGFNPTKETYDVEIPTNVDKVLITATATEEATITINGVVISSTAIDINGNTPVTIVISKEKRDFTSYTLNLNQKKDAGINSISINSASLSGNSPYTYALNTNDSVSGLSLVITTNDPLAVIQLPVSDTVGISGEASSIGTGSYGLSIASGDATPAINFTITSGTSNPKTGSYSIMFKWPIVPTGNPTGDES